MTDKRGYYEVLDVERTVDEVALKAAFRRKAMEHHPDKNQGDPSAEGRFKEVNEAYSVLSDPQKRAAYDRFGHGFGTASRTTTAGRTANIFDEVFGRDPIGAVYGRDPFGFGAPKGNPFGDISRRAASAAASEATSEAPAPPKPKPPTISEVISGYNRGDAKFDGYAVSLWLKGKPNMVAAFSAQADIVKLAERDSGLLRKELASRGALAYAEAVSPACIANLNNGQKAGAMILTELLDVRIPTYGIALQNIDERTPIAARVLGNVTAEILANNTELTAALARTLPKEVIKKVLPVYLERMNQGSDSSSDLRTVYEGVDRLNIEDRRIFAKAVKKGLAAPAWARIRTDDYNFFKNMDFNSRTGIGALLRDLNIA